MQPFQGIDDSGDQHHRFLMYRRIGMVQYAQVRVQLLQLGATTRITQPAPECFCIKFAMHIVCAVGA
jgi:hypothetical protein